MIDRILCDLDGVVLNFIDPLCSLLNERNDLSNTRGYSPKDFRSYPIEATLASRQMKQFLGWMEDASLCLARTWYPGAKTFLSAIQSVAPVAFLTAGGPGRWNDYTKQLLAQSYNCDRLIFASPDQKAEYDGLTLIEDRPDTAESWSEKNKAPAVLINRPWNHETETSPRVLRARNYTHATALISEICKR